MIEPVTLGPCTLYHADCRDLLPIACDAVITDPPYCVSLAGISHVGQPGRGTRRFDFFDGDSDWSSMLSLWLDALTKCIAGMREHASLYAWVGHRQFGPTVEALERAGFKTRFLVWNKTCPAPPPPGAGWPSAAELCVYGWRNGRRWTHGGSNPPKSNVLLADSFRYGQPGKVDHPTQKPEVVITPLLLASSFENDLVLDPFMGSGTTGIACIRTGRKFLGIEKERKYFDIACDRIRRELDQFTLPLEIAPRPTEQELPI